MKIVKNILTIVCLLLGNFSQAQHTLDSVKQLPAITIYSSRLYNFSTGNKIEVLDSVLLERYSSSNLSDLLAKESQVFIKSYGLGSLASTSFRGAGSSHTAVLWNGFNLQSPIYGMLDMSLIPVSFINDVQLQYGGNGAMWGSGAVGGTVHLNNKATFNKGLSVLANTSIASFEDYQEQLSVEISKKKLVASIKLFNHDAKNDFDYTNIAKRGSPSERITNAELKQYGFLQQNDFKINKRQHVNTRLWYQFNDRNLPPSMTESVSVSNQQDEFWRASAEWVRIGDKVHALVRSAYFNERLLYADSLINLLSNNKSTTFITEAESRFRITKFDVMNIGINNTYNRVTSVNYIEPPEQNRVSLFASYKTSFLKSRLNTMLSARQEFIDGDAVPLTTSFGVDAQVHKLLKIKANAAQHYRVPSFNDLYWAQGGNPNLAPESGWSEEVSLVHHHHFKAFTWELEATAFNRNIDNWIIWLPNSIGIWSPDNVLEVWSRGMEYKANVNFKLSDVTVNLSGLYNYILSTNEKAVIGNENTIGKQLIYVPIQNGQGGLSFTYKKTALNYTQTYTGYRYTLSDNAKYLAPYTIGNIRLSHVFKLNKVKVNVYAQLNNIWKATYQVMAYRPMPLLNYKVGLSVYFNQANKKTN